jgi:hypothetical protein
MTLFQFPEKTEQGIIQFKQKFDKKITSWKGKYRHHRKGLNEDIPNVTYRLMGKMNNKFVQGLKHRIPISFNIGLY